MKMSTEEKTEFILILQNNYSNKYTSSSLYELFNFPLITASSILCIECYFY